jgi:superfamily II DNA/RNA helicase
VVSDDAGASARIEQFGRSDQRWMVAVRMVSEGVDVPRLLVGVYATSTSTPLFFAQAVGRFVRARRRGETASVFLPSVPALLGLAAELERDRDHVLDAPRRTDQADGEWSPEAAELAAANRAERASEALRGAAFEALDAQATFDRVLFDRQEFGTAAEVGSEHEQGYLELPGLIDPEEMTSALRARQAEQLAGQAASSPRSARSAGSANVTEVALHREVTALRKELHSLVGAWARRTGQQHGVVHAELRRTCGGPEVAKASAEEVRARIATLRNRFVGRR